MPWRLKRVLFGARDADVVHLIGGSWSLEDVNVCIVLEYCERGSLQALRCTPAPSPAPYPSSGVPSLRHARAPLRRCAHAATLLAAAAIAQVLLENEPSRSTLSWAKHKLPIATGIARAMAYLHHQRPPVIHRDLKPANGETAV